MCHEGFAWGSFANDRRGLGKLGFRKRTYFGGGSEKVTYDARYLSLSDTAAYLGRGPRWMRRHYRGLIKSGVVAYRVPKNSIKGRIMFEKSSLDQYIQNCRIN